MTLWTYLNLLRQPDLWERRIAYGRNCLCLKDGTGEFNTAHNGLILWASNPGSLQRVYEPGDLAHFFLVAPLAIWLNRQIP